MTTSPSCQGTHCHDVRLHGEFGGVLEFRLRTSRRKRVAYGNTIGRD